MSRKTITLHELTKVEGHAKLNVEMDGKEVKKAEMAVFEPSRYFESMIVGKSYADVPSISQRICGICSVIHTITSIKAVEDAIGVEPSQQTEDLRRLLLYSSNTHSHTAHLFFFAAPDYLGIDNALELVRKDRKKIELALELQRLSSGIVKAIGGRSLHPVTPRVGGFNSVPSREKIRGMIDDFKKVKQLAQQAARLFMSFKLPKFENRTQYLGLTKPGGYPLYDGDMGALGSSGFKPSDYGKHLQEEVIFRSTAKYAKFNGKPYMVGALARLNINRRSLSASAKSLLRQSRIKVPCFSTFTNNFAQALEMVHFSDLAIETLEKYEDKGMRDERPDVRAKAGEGVAICEAPRGSLIHHYRFDGRGKATFANIMTPTCQNVRNMEFDMQKLIPGIIKQPDRKIKKTLEMLIRAYDPCFSCSTHFLDFRMKR
jgi:sulfhydrogenase subunit alpha